MGNFRTGVRCAALFIAIAGLGPSVVEAGSLTGKLELPAPGKRAPTVSRGYLPRMDNAVLPVRPRAVHARIVVVAEPASGAAVPTPTQVSWELLGDSFAKPLLAVVQGTEISVKNKGRGAVSLVAPERKDLIALKTTDREGTVVFKATELGSFEVGEIDTPHVRGRVAVFTSPYLAIPDATGKFEFKDLPPGRYTVKLWFDTGWLDRADELVDVGTGESKFNPKVTSLALKAR